MAYVKDTHGVDAPEAAPGVDGLQAAAGAAPAEVEMTEPTTEAGAGQERESSPAPEAGNETETWKTKRYRVPIKE
jgi:hypothetical protein